MNQTYDDPYKKLTRTQLSEVAYRATMKARREFEAIGYAKSRSYTPGDVTRILEACDEVIAKKARLKSQRRRKTDKAESVLIVKHRPD